VKTFDKTVLENLIFPSHDKKDVLDYYLFFKIENIKTATDSFSNGSRGGGRKDRF
jgi:hypothetical protein